MKVLFISAWYPHRYDPMSGLFVQKHAESVSLYADVKSLYVHADSSIKKFEIISNFYNNIEEYRVYYPYKENSFFGKIQKAVNFFRAYNKGFKKIKKTSWKPDIVQASVFTRTALIACIAKTIYGTPYAVIEHWTRYFREKTFRNSIHKFISIYTAKKASAVLPVTLHLQKNMEKHGMNNNNYNVINNVVDDFFFKKQVAAEKLSKVRILNVTCFNDDQKNITGILRVVEKLSKIRTDFEIYFVGTGTDEKIIKDYEKSLTIPADIVYFTGLLKGENLAKMYQNCDFTILFSNYENIPVVISESLVCGKPVVSTSVGGINEHICDKNGILIEKGDEKALQNAMNFMIDNFGNYNKNMIQKEAEEKYSYSNVGKNLFEIYKKTLNL